MKPTNNQNSNHWKQVRKGDFLQKKAHNTRLFNALAKGGQITMPLNDMFWGAYFGMLTDQFGVQWMVNCDQNE
jgi:PhnB protein